MADQSTEARLREALKPFVDCCEYIDENESDAEWAKFWLLIKHYRRAHEAFSLPDTSDDLTRLRAEVEAKRDYPTEDAYLRACRALHWHTAQLRSLGVEPDAIPVDATHYPPDGHVFENRRTK